MFSFPVYIYIYIYIFCPGRTHGTVHNAFGQKVFLSEITWSLLVQSQQLRIRRNTYYKLTLVPGHSK